MSGEPVVKVSPRWPSEVMTGVAGKFANTYARYLESPPAFLFMSFLTYLGHATSGQVTLESELTPEPRLFTVLLGESADARKSTALKKTFDFFATLPPNITCTLWGVGSAEGLAKLLKNNPRAILIQDELKSLIQKMRIDSSILLPCINSLFESNQFYSATKSHDIAIPKAELSLLAASTIETYRNMFTATFMDIGFLNRLFIVVGNSERRFALPPVIPQAVKDAILIELKQVLSFVSSLSTECYAMQLDPEARDIFVDWYKGQDESLFNKRLDTYGHRLMVLLAINESSRVVTKDIAERTVKLLDYQLAARRYADPIDADNALAKQEERIRRALVGGPVLKRDLERQCSKTRVGIWLWDKAINNLKRDREIEYDEERRLYRLITEQ